MLASIVVEKEIDEVCLPSTQDGQAVVGSLGEVLQAEQLGSASRVCCTWWEGLQTAFSSPGVLGTGTVASELLFV